ncbi:hypothetical protein BD311DRAFT_32706 [Dichomitus squalens]|uniref:Secreted protein n=1 Tax=Dichomitus squalens TaxID=114155 RepID=A0A4Q9MWG9_9APHY|nr:hypothetical protein BD311DRAFT_32706 [Dichomitus squalens]
MLSSRLLPSQLHLLYFCLFVFLPYPPKNNAVQDPVCTLHSHHLCVPSGRLLDIPGCSGDVGGFLPDFWHFLAFAWQNSSSRLSPSSSRHLIGVEYTACHGQRPMNNRLWTSTATHGLLSSTEDAEAMNLRAALTTITSRISSLTGGNCTCPVPQRRAAQRDGNTATSVLSVRV